MSTQHIKQNKKASVEDHQYDMGFTHFIALEELPKPEGGCMNKLDQIKAYFAVDENGLRRCECINDSAIATEDVDDERDNGYVPDDMLPSKYFQIGCHKCDLEVIRDTKEEAIKAWNTRTSDPLIRSLLDELIRSILDELVKKDMKL